MKIRIIIHTVSRLMDINGNTYHYAIITNPENGKSVAVRGLCDVDDAGRFVRQALGLEWGEVYRNGEWLKPREWDRHMRSYTECDWPIFYTHELGRETLAGELGWVDDDADCAPSELIEKAREIHCASTYDIEVDDDARISRAEDGDWVQAWVWVPREGGEE